MDQNINEIIKLQLLDLGITAEETHYRIASDYYQIYGTIPSTDNLLMMVLSEDNEEDITLIETDNIDEIMWIYNDAYIAHRAVYNNPEYTLGQTNLIDVKKVSKNIDNIPLLMYKNIIDPITTECFICYDKFTDTDIIRSLPCNHILHRHCIDNYLLNISYQCPYCRTASGPYVYL